MTWRVRATSNAKFNAHTRSKLSNAADLKASQTMNDDISFILSRFPTYRSKIVDQYLHNEEFKTLCEDLYSSAKILEEQQKVLFSQYQGELEYRKLYLELERELVRFLSSAPRSA